MDWIDDFCRPTVDLSCARMCLQWGFPAALIFKKIYLFLLKDNCFTEFYCFLSNLNMNQP